MLYDLQYVYWLFADNCRLGCLKMQSFLLGFLLGVRRGKSVALNATRLLIMWWLLGCLLHVAMFF